MNRKLNFWQLACITGSALGLPAMVMGGFLAKEYGPSIALTSIFIGNLLLWMIGLVIVSMTDLQHHAIENVEGYLGKPAATFASLVLVIAFLTWYAVQVQGATTAISSALNTSPHWAAGGVLGLLVTCLSFKGVRLIEKVCLVGFPLLFAYAIYLIVSSTYKMPFLGSWDFSFSAIVSVALIWLPGTVNLPTFFRHSRSRPDSVLGLSLMTIIHVFFQSFTVLVGIYDSSMLFSSYSGNFPFLYVMLTSGFILLAFTCINLVNIYLASAGWETLFPQHRGSKEYMIVGLLGTLLYFILQMLTASFHMPFPIGYLETTMANWIAILGFVLLMDFLMRKIVKHRPRSLEKLCSSFCWLIGNVAAALVQYFTSWGSNEALIVGVCASLLVFLMVIFIEETVWSIKHLKQRA